ncbi:MAG: hypothetical protein RIC55_28250 [Pirellulaceae bacterium]
MPEHTTPTLELVLTHDDGLGRIAVDMQAFFELSFELAEDLQDLVEQHQHLANRRRQQNLLTIRGVS